METMMMVVIAALRVMAAEMVAAKVMVVVA